MENTQNALYLKMKGEKLRPLRGLPVSVFDTKSMKHKENKIKMK